MGWLADRFELQRSGADRNILAMEGVRGLAVLLVFLVHYSTLVEPWMQKDSSAALLALQLHALGNVGVDLFFVLSGYLIYGSLIARPQPFVDFMRRRIRRIYPAFIAVFAIYLALSWARSADSKIPRHAIEALLYLSQNFLLLPGMLPIEPLIAVAWSLSYEMLYYLVIPVLIGAMRLRAWQPRWRCLFFICAAVAMIAAPDLVGGHPRLSMFIAGILLFEALRSGRTWSPGTGIALVFLGLGIAAPALPFQQMAGGQKWMLCLMFVSFLVFCLECFKARDPARAWLTRCFTWTPARWLGNMSYSFYLIHGLTLKVAFLALAGVYPPAPHGMAMLIGLLPAMLAGATLVSAALFLWIERPFSLVKQHDAAPGCRPAAAANQSPPARRPKAPEPIRNSALRSPGA
jgi:exopolysaccharide production protein ExoZ